MRITLPEKKKLVFESRFPVRWGDMDAMGHVNNTVYFKYLEHMRIDCMSQIGCPPDAKGEGPVIVNAFCNFHKQLTYPSDVLGKLFVSDLGRSTFDSWCTLERVDEPGVIYTSGGATMVWVDFPAQKSAPLPDWLRTIVA